LIEILRIVFGFTGLALLVGVIGFGNNLFFIKIKIDFAPTTKSKLSIKNTKRLSKPIKIELNIFLPHTKDKTRKIKKPYIK
jgi:hypothetical protein